MLLTLAFRNLWRNRRRTLLTLSAMVVSAALLILALGVFSGMFKDMLASATEQYYGHLVIARPEYHLRRDLFAHLPADIADQLPLENEAEITGKSPRLRSFGLLSRPETSQPVELLGIIPRMEQQVTSLQHQLTAGHYPTEEEHNGALIGQGLARKMKVKPGDEMVFVTQAADGSIGNDLLIVSGIFATGDSRHDNNLVLAPLPWLQQVLVLPGRIHEVAMVVADPMTAAQIADRLTAALPENIEVLDWGDLLPEMREVIAAYDVSRMIVVTILYLATGLGILNTFFMSVMERTREFGILMAQGMRPWTIRGLVLLETLLLGGLALVIGLLCGAILTLYMQQIGIDLSGYITSVTYAGGTILPRLHAVFEAGNFLVPAGMLLLVSLFAGFLPANRAARLDPVVAVRDI
ncbi:MAG: ABC transporter permease [Desulfuromonadales bacterium]|nr:ABC transporter permease [Desulfuromonadales bacterium]